MPPLAYLSSVAAVFNVVLVAIPPIGYLWCPVGARSRVLHVVNP